VMTRRKQYDEQKAYLASLALEIVEPDEAQVNEEEVLTRGTSATRLGPPHPHLRRDWARRGHICAGTGLTPATFAPGLGAPAAMSALRPHPLPWFQWVG
jgi:hypothetical protein